MKRYLLTMLFVLCSVILAAAQDAVLTPEDSGYLIGPGDIITGKVLGETQFDFETAIDQDGKFEVPFFEQPIMAKCRTEKELRADVTKLLSKFLRNPMISLRVTERNSRPPVTVYGEVRSQQRVDLRRETRLLELLSFAGGVTEDAGGIVRVYRTRPPLCEESNEQVAWKKTDADYEVPSRLYSLSSIKSGDQKSNPIIFPGDLIVVEKASPVYITGEVNAPQGIRIPEGGLSLQRAIAMVSGVRREAKTKDVKIYRLKLDSQDREIISANYDKIKKGEQKDIMLEPYDIVEVDKSKKSIGQIILDIAIGAAKGGITTIGTGLPSTILY